MSTSTPLQHMQIAPGDVLASGACLTVSDMFNSECWQTSGAITTQYSASQHTLYANWTARYSCCGSDPHFKR